MFMSFWRLSVVLQVTSFSCRESDSFHISNIAYKGGLYFFTLIRSLVAMTTCSFHWLLLGKVEINVSCHLTLDLFFLRVMFLK